MSSPGTALDDGRGPAGSQPVSSYKRRPPPFVLRLVLGVILYGLLGPILRVLGWLGANYRIFRFMTVQRLKRQKAANPFRNYVATRHDVFVATFAKSGTNWIMQIAHQLAFHGNGEFEHIHCAVPWPDTVLMGPMRGYAIPIEDSSVRKASPEQKRVIKNPLRLGLSALFGRSALSQRDSRSEGCL